MKIRSEMPNALLLCGIFLASALLCYAFPAHAQTAAQDQLRATIHTEITADPRSAGMSPAQINAMVDALTTQAEKQGLTSSDLTYRPSTTLQATNAASAPSACSDFFCMVSNAFGFDGSYPLIPIGLFVSAALFILIFGIMREMGHPHAQQFASKK